MLNLLLTGTGLVVLVAMWSAYQRTADPLHPLMFLGPMFLFIYVVQPAALIYRNLLEPYFPDPAMLDEVQGIYLAGVSLFCLGCLKRHRVERAPIWKRDVFVLTPVVRKRILTLGYALGALGLGAYTYMILRAGGFVQAFSVMKGGGSASSGYIGEAPLLVFPAIVLVAIGWRGTPFSLGKSAVLMGLALPFVSYGFLGGRRGPMFMALAILFLPWWLVYRKRPSLKALLAGLCIVGMAVLFVWSQRDQMFFGSDFEFDKEAMIEKVLPSEVDTGHEYIFGAGQILNALYHNQYFWGKRYFVTFVIRPIPRQIWPTKYKDMGMNQFTAGHSSFGDESAWRESLGWAPLAGAANGLIADLFVEFSWFGLIAMYMIGAFFGYLWERALVEGGLWILVYVEASVLSIYLPSQSLGAWLYRFLFMAVPTIYLWKHYIGPSQRAHRYESMREAAKKSDMPLTTEREKPHGT